MTWTSGYLSLDMQRISVRPYLEKEPILITLNLELQLISVFRIGKPMHRLRGHIGKRAFNLTIVTGVSM